MESATEITVSASPMAAASGPIFHNLTGIPPWGSWRWVHTGSLGGPTGYYGESGGSVLLSNGVGCNSGLAVAD